MSIGLVDNATIPAATSSELGVNIQRYDVMWHGQEVFDGTLDFSPGVSSIVAVYGRAWDVPTTDEARSRYCGFVDSILTRYPNVAGVVVWNEPGTKVGQGYNWPAGLSYDVYGRLLAACSPIIKAYKSLVIGPGMHPWSLDEARPLIEAVAAAGPHLLDAWDVHLYNGRSLKPMIALVRSILGWRIPVWVTEDGIESYNPNFANLYFGPVGQLYGVSVTEAQQAYLDSGYMLNAYCAGADAWMNFKLRDEADLTRWQSGLERPDGSHKLSYQAFAVTAWAIESGVIDCANPEPPRSILPEKDWCHVEFDPWAWRFVCP